MQNTRDSSKGKINYWLRR